MQVIINIILIIAVSASFLLAGESSGSDVDGASVYTWFGCQACHGGHRGGTAHGPSLRTLASNWDEKTLSQFLTNPVEAREKNERLRKISDRYAPGRMAKFDFADNELKALVKYLLENSKPAYPSKEPSSSAP